MMRINKTFGFALSAIASALVVAGCGGDSGTAALTPQVISFTAPATATVGGTATLAATASSALAVAYTSATTAVCTVAGSVVTYAAAGTCTINANQAGNGTFSPAAQVSGSVTVAPPVISLVTGFKASGTSNGGAWATYADWGNFSPSTVNALSGGNPVTTGFGGGGWGAATPIEVGGYTYFGIQGPVAITGGQMGIYATAPTPVTIAGQTTLKIPLAIGGELVASTQATKSLYVLLTGEYFGADNCNYAVQAEVTGLNATLTEKTITLSAMTVAPSSCNTASHPAKTAAQILAAPIVAVHAQLRAPSFNATATAGNFVTAYTIGSPIKLQ
jgi:hypothetical protein